MQLHFVIEGSFDIEAQIISQPSHDKNYVRAHCDILSFSEELAGECYHSFSQSIIYLNNLESILRLVLFFLVDSLLHC